MLIYGKNFFDILIKNREGTCEQIIKMRRNNDYMTDNLLDYEYFFEHYKLIAVDLSTQNELENPDLKQQVDAIGRLTRNEGATMFYIIEKSKEITFQFSQNAATVVWSGLCIKIETQKLVNLLGDANNEFQNLQQKNGMLSMFKITQTMVKETKIVQPLNLKPKSLHQIFEIIQTHIFL